MTHKIVHRQQRSPITVTNLLILTFFLFSQHALANGITPVWINHVEIIGQSTDGVRSFLGIPFAQAPVDGLRWQSPQRDVRLTSPFLANSFAPACPQGDSNTRWYQDVANRLHGSSSDIPIHAPPRIAEDCLALNIWAPTDTTADTPVPVMVWIHGGGHRDGYAYEPNYQGQALARQMHVMVVSIGYRLNIFGFMPPTLLETHALPLGLQDQIAALEWVHQNIRAFGGDADNVTIAGESAGAADVETLLLEPKFAHLFRRAISQSGGFILLDHYRRSRALQLTKHFYQHHFKNVSPVQLTQVPMESLINAASSDSLDEAYRPINRLNGESDPTQRLKRLGINHDLLIGSNQDEWRMYFNDENQTRESYLKSLPKSVQQLLTPIGINLTDRRERLDAVYSLVNFHCPTLLLAEATRPPHRAYVYRFARVREHADAIGSYHGAEIPYVFNTHDAWLPTSEADRQLTEQMMAAWAAFMWTGDPNAHPWLQGEPRTPVAAWPQYQRTQPKWMRWNTPNSQAEDISLAPICRQLVPMLYNSKVDYGAS
jgi:para-nitrobenzyl esterase